MTLEQATARRTLAARLAALCCGLALLGVLDALVASLRTPVNLVHTLPGANVAIDGPAPEVAQAPQDLAAKDDTRRPDAFQVAITDIHRGYFLGGHRWRGNLTVSAATPPGKYTLVVYAAQNPAKGGMAFRVVVHPDEGSLRRSSLSLFLRFLDVSPWKVAFLCLPFILAAFGTVFLMSQTIERLLAARGLAEVYRVVRKEGVLEVAFGLGTSHGVSPGSRLRLLNQAREPVGVVEVRESSATDSLGVTFGDHEVEPGFLVSLN